LIYSLRAKTWKRFSLNASIDSKVNVVDEKIKVGVEGVSITRLAPVGMAEFNGERVEVYTSTSYIDANTPLIIEAVEGNRIRVNVKK
jgi:membrane-bound ClpP family serine protease